jgi:hypothetical protein
MLIFLFYSLVFANCDHCSIFPLPDLELFTARYKVNKKCERPLGIGEARLANQRALQAENGRPVDQRYLLVRESEHSYQAIFNLNFIMGEAPAQNLTAKQMEERVRNCVSLVPPIKGPENREIKIRVINQSEEVSLRGEPPPRIDINVVAAQRGNSLNFAEDFSCAQIVHEIMHHAGLCDEYREAQDLGAHDNTGECRPMGPGNSFMSDGMNQAFDDAVGAPFSCSIADHPRLKEYLSSAGPLLAEYLFKRDFNVIGNAHWLTLGVKNPPSGKTAKEICCQQGVTTPLKDVNPSSPRIKLIQDSEEHLQFTTVDAFFMNNSKEPRLLEKSMSCRLRDVDVNFRPACREYLEYLRPQLQAASDPNRVMYDCPGGSIAPPKIFNLRPGSIKREGDVVHLRSKGNGRPLLHSQHFTRVLAGPCDTAETANYDRCAKFSYKHTAKFLKCEDLPPECRERSWVGELVRGI